MTNPDRMLSPNLQDDDKHDFVGIDVLYTDEKLLKKYNMDIVSKLSQYSNTKTDVLDFGAGIGTLAKLWYLTTTVKPECVEIDENLRNILIERKFNCYSNIDSIHKEFDVIYTSNVLEHIKDDTGALKKLHSKLKTNGIIAIYVPAFMCIYSGLDFAVGHYRRYKKKELVHKLYLAGFKIKKCYFVDSLGFFSSLVMKLYGYKKEEKLMHDKIKKNYDKYIYPLSRLLDFLGLKFLFGKNLLVIATKI